MQKETKDLKAITKKFFAVYGAHNVEAMTALCAACELLTSDSATRTSTSLTESRSRARPSHELASGTRVRGLAQLLVARAWKPPGADRDLAVERRQHHAFVLGRGVEGLL